MNNVAEIIPPFSSDSIRWMIGMKDLGGGTQADSIMDRIIHNAYEIPTSETNLRKIYDSKKLKRLIDEIEL